MKALQWMLFGVAVMLSLLPRLPIDTSDASRATTAWALMLIWGVVLAHSFAPIGRLLGYVRRVPGLFVLLWGGSVVGVLTVWVLVFQPAAGIAIEGRGLYWLVGGLFWALLFWGAGFDAQARQNFGARAGWGVGVALTVVTLALTLFGTELFLRYGMVMSDNFAFSKMHQNWVRLYWQPINEWGYRDNPPASADPDKTHILIMGDSLVTGYGVDDINDTFPHQLGRALGDNYTVNIVAQPGWGISSALGAVMGYPLKPDVLIVSHYLNDIIEGDARAVYNAPFPVIRLNPPSQWAWWVEQTYLGNFYYYRLYHYFEYDSTGAYFDWTRNAYADSATWQAYQEELGRVVAYADEEGIALYVIVWANLADVAGTAPYSAQVAAYFRQAGVPVVDMGVVLADAPRADLVANAFDSHPSAWAHEQAARALGALMGVP